MGESIFGSGFDLRDYVHKRALEINNLEERTLYRQITDGMMAELFQYLIDAQSALEQRVLSEVRPCGNDFAIHIGVTERELYDASDSFLMPICPEDITSARPTAAECLRSDAPAAVERVFLRQNTREARKFAEDGALYQGAVTTDKGTFPATFFVRRSRRYLERVERLYQVFHANHIPWATVCAAYLYKMFDVFVSDVEGLEANSTDEIRSVSVDFGAYDPFLHRGMVPLWNLAGIEVNTSMYPSPCADHVHCEHRIFAHRLAPGCHYLVADLERPLRNVRMERGDMLITCQERGPVAWNLIQVNQDTEKLRYEYTPLVNQPADSFASNLGIFYQQGIKTLGELRHTILSYGYSDVVSFQRAELGAQLPAEAESYDMDQFITDELRKKSARETMLLHFAAADPDHYLNMDLVSFLVTKAQKIFPEYVCVGVLDM